MLSMSQEVGERSRTFLEKVQGKAAACDFKIRCTEKGCREGGNYGDFTDTIVKCVLINGLANAEIRREILGWESLDESSLPDVAAFIEQKEMEREALKGEAVVERTGYKIQQATASPADGATLRRKVRCDENVTQTNQYVQKRSTKEPKTEADKKEGGAAIMPVSGNLSGSCQGEGAAKVRKMVSRHTHRARNNNFKISLSNNTEVAMTRLRIGAAVVLENHVFDSRTSWTQRKAWKHPKL